MATAWPAAAITLVESPEVAIIGVGKGSTPQLAGFMAKLKLSDADWMPAADATYKAGIAFAGWSRRDGYDRYFHPFASALDLHTEPAFHAATRARRLGADVPAHPDGFFVNSWLAVRGRAPLPADNFPFAVGHGFHFDAHRIGGVLRRAALQRAVVHRQGRVASVDVDPAGAVAALVLDDGARLTADLFVDASGFRSLIAQAALGEPFRSFAENLFNDRAVVIATPADPAPLAQTTATALDHGWAWQIPLTTRTGNGYVYASAYCSPDEAETELRRHLRVADDLPARHLTMRVGRVERSWTANCLAIGLAQGFLEPLEATALHLVQATVEGFVEAWERGRFTTQHRDGFNRTIARRYEGVRDYIVAHYRLNQRTDTAYWHDNAAHDRLSDSLKALMTCWFTGGDLVEEIARQDIGRYYAPLSWGCLFAGYGTFPDRHRLRPAAAPPSFADFLARCGSNFPGHADALASLRGGIAA